MDGRSVISCPCGPYIRVKYWIRYLPVGMPASGEAFARHGRAGAAGAAAPPRGSTAILHVGY